ncbi:MAG: class F sortase [Aeromicrobium sp.]
MRTRAAATATAVLALAGVFVSLTALWPRPDTGSQIPIVEPGPSAALEPRVPDAAPSPVERVVAAMPSAAPDRPRTVRVQVASGGIDSAVRPVGVAPDGQMALPADPEVLGWYRFGPAPGDGTGSVVLAGHLDSKRYGLGPLVGLREVDAGDLVGITRSDGTRRSYTVVDVRRYDQQALPEELFARTGPERLRIITCGGDYLPDEGGYQQNLVVTAVPN